MKPIKKAATFYIVFSVLFFAGCTLVDESIPVGYIPPAPSSPQAVQQRFVSADDEAASAVESALKWSKKYEELLAETDKLRQQNEQLTLEKNDLSTKLSTTEAQLDKTKKELYEANEFLKETHLELTSWKKDVLGFRDEIRGAQTAELQALTKILRILGAEPIVATETEESTESASPSEG